MTEKNRAYLRAFVGSVALALIGKLTGNEFAIGIFHWFAGALVGVAAGYYFAIDQQQETVSQKKLSETRDRLGAVRAAMRAQPLTWTERQMLEWLGSDDRGGLYGECKGNTLDGLLIREFARIGPVPAGRKNDLDYARVVITMRGREALKQ